jgi:hypothetical protein
MLEREDIAGLADDIALLERDPNPPGGFGHVARR